MLVTQPPLDRPRWRRAVARAWRADTRDAKSPPTERLLRVESRDGSVVSSGKFTGDGKADDHWRCTAAAPAVKWMDGLRWKKAREQLAAAGYSWQWL